MRGRVVMTAVVSVALMVGACGSDSDSDTTTDTNTTATSERSAAGATESTAKPTNGTGGEVAAEGSGPALQSDVDQKPPMGLNGIVVAGQTLYAASINANQVLAIDATSGDIVGRWGLKNELGVPDDLVLDGDGSLVVTGYGAGDVSRIAADGTISLLGNIGAGANPINISPDGVLYVGRALIGDGLYRFDPASKSFVEITPNSQGLNGFDFDDSRAIVGPLLSLNGPSSIVRVDPDSGAITPLVEDLGPIGGVEVDGDTVFAAQISPPALLRLSLADLSAAPETVVTLPFIPDNLALADDGTVFVTSFGTPEIARISPDGQLTVISVGKG